MTQYIESLARNDNPARSDLRQDGQTLPPFVALDDLDKSVAVLDEWVSNFIGRMQPYRHEMPGERIRQAEATVSPDERSGLENRIYQTSRRIGQIREALDDMNEGLRL